MTLSEQHYKDLLSFRIRTFANKAMEIAEDPAFDKYTFIEKLGFCIDEEKGARIDRRVNKLNHKACFSHPTACVEDIAY